MTVEEHWDARVQALIDLTESLRPTRRADGAGVVLVVEDDPDLCLLARMQLEYCGHTVLVAADGIEALECLSKHAVDIAIVDIQMPRMDGRALLAAMQADEQLRVVPVIVATAYGGADGVVETLALGAQDYLEKPYRPEELGARVSVALRVRHLEDDLRLRNDTLARDLTRTLELESELRTAEERFRVAFQNAPIGMALTGIRFGSPARLLKVNAALVSLTGRSEEELLNGSLIDLVAPPDRASHAAGIALLEAGSAIHERREERIVHPSGEIRWALRCTSLVAEGDAAEKYLVHQIEDITERRMADERLNFQALHDSLTNLPNRVLFMDRLSQALGRVKRDREGLAVLFCDLDSFKVVNDSLGHDVGDQLLVAMADRITLGLRPSDSAARIGGDEFVVLCDGISTEDEAVSIADRLAELISKPFEIAGTEVHITASIGIAGTFSGSVQREELMRDADTAMYKAKRSGKARSALCDDALRASATERLHLENALRAGMVDKQFRLHYQPVIHLDTGRISGVEALVRWERPGHGLLAPGAFLDVAEESRLIVDIGRWALTEACRQSARWSRAFPDHPLSVAINLSGRQLDRTGLADLVREILAESGADPANLCLEVTESVLVEATTSTLDDLRRLKEIGVKLAIDDFGTGFSSLTYLKRFPVDTVKVDGSFVHGLGKDPDDRAIVDAVLALGRGLHLDTVAEGVETRTQLDLLRALHCSHAQGYLFARPAPADKVSLLLTR